jgi:hypothetical protein
MVNERELGEDSLPPGKSMKRNGLNTASTPAIPAAALTTFLTGTLLLVCVFLTPALVRSLPVICILAKSRTGTAGPSAGRCVLPFKKPGEGGTRTEVEPMTMSPSRSTYGRDVQGGEAISQCLEMSRSGVEVREPRGWRGEGRLGLGGNVSLFGSW